MYKIFSNQNSVELYRILLNFIKFYKIQQNLAIPIFFCYDNFETLPLTQRASRHPPPLSSRYVHPCRSPRPKPTQTLHPPQIPIIPLPPSSSLSLPTHPPSVHEDQAEAAGPAPLLAAALRSTRAAAIAECIT
jgi:hypothetical protein